jgi:tellurium resistance protein TerD
VVELDSYPGDIDRYCKQHAALLEFALPGPRPTILPAAPIKAALPSVVLNQSQVLPQMQTQAAPSILVTKGGNVSLTKIVPELAQLSLQLGWKAPAAAGADMELDASAFMLSGSGKVRNDDDFIFYGQTVSVCSSVVLQQEGPVGLLGDDKARVQIDLAGLPRAVVCVAICVTIDNADARRQSFSQVHNAFVRIVDVHSGHVFCRFDLVNDYSTETSLIFGEIYRYKDEWKFKAVGQGFSGGLAALCGKFGVEVI